MTTMYGIPNCDTIKKAKSWLQEQDIDFEFHDYKKQSPDKETLDMAIAEYGMDVVLNKRGTTYRKLSDEQKAFINEGTVVEALIDNPSMIKRPILRHNNKIIVGFKADLYTGFFNLD